MSLMEIPEEKGANDAMTAAVIVLTSSVLLPYSYRSASIGFSRDAFNAGKNPETIPTIDRMMNEIIITLIDACRKIAPS